VSESDELLDAEALAANRRDAKRAAVITVLALAAVVAGSVLAICAGVPG
jgi:hypothetical protein